MIGLARFFIPILFCVLRIASTLAFAAAFVFTVPSESADASAPAPAPSSTSTSAYPASSAPTAAAAEIDNPTVRVRFTKKASVVRIVGYGLRFGGSVGLGLPLKKRLNLYRVQDGFRIEEESHSVALYPLLPLKLVGDEIQIENERAPDVLYFVPRDDGDMDIVAEMPLENYLKGVLPAEMPASWPLEALKAQAVAARTYAESILKERAGESYHLDSTVDHQVFHWESYTGGLVAQREKIARAVDETRGVKLVDENGEVISAYFHSHCGGTTEEPQKVWGTGVSMGVVKDASCALDKSAEWRAQISKKDLIKKLAIRGAIDAVYLGPLDASGRNSSIVFDIKNPVNSAQEQNSSVATYKHIITGQDFRRLVGYTKVKSTRFTISWDGSQLVIHGRGNGHGAGLCQTGAKFMALAGGNHQQILNHYYPKAQLSFPKGVLAQK